MRNQRGLTLVETLIALALVAGVSLSVLAMLGQSARFIVEIQTRMFASIAAENLLIADLASRNPPQVGAGSGVISVGVHEFVYERTVADIGRGVLQIEFAVRREEGGQTLSRVSVLRRP